MVDRELRLDVAGCVFRVTGASAVSRRWARERYAPFLTGQRADFTLRIRPRLRAPAGRPGRSRVDWARGRFTIKLATCRAEGDLRRRTALLVTPPMPAAVSPAVFRAICSLQLLAEGGLLLHASAVAGDAGAWIFCGPSQSGKTTLATLASPRWVLNDETVAVVRRGHGYVAAATPFFGSGGPVMAGRNGQAPVRALFFLRRGGEGFAHRRLRPAEAVARVWSQLFAPKRDGAVAGALLNALVAFAQSTPCFDLAFSPTPEVWEYLDAIA